MDRRTFVNALAGGLAIARSAASAQQAAKVARIGFLAGSLASAPHLREAFRQGLRDLGYVEERVDADGGLVPHLSARLSRFVG